MRIARLNYTRFGHFTDFALDLPPGPGSDFHIILGANEAGKSTMVEGWLNLIYGIPRNTPYAFRHDRSTLEISALIEDSGHRQTLTRLPVTRQSLVGQDGNALHEAVLAGLLRGVGEDAYRQLYCLDDDTIEKGGDDILASKGDLGQLLFAAASGMAAFNETLERMREDDRAFHVASGAGRRGSTVAKLRKEFDERSAAIKNADLTAPEYRRLREAAEKAATAAAHSKANHAALIAQEAALRAKLNALPILGELEALEAALARLGTQPVLPESAPADIADLSTRREAQLASLRARRADVAIWAAERDKLQIDPRADGLAEALAGLRPLRNRAEDAAQDLPSRETERNDTLAEAQALLSRLDLPQTDPLHAEFSAAAINRLDKAAQAHGIAEQKLLDATHEAALAEDALARARDTAPEAGEAQTVPDALEALLTKLDADETADALSEARAASSEAAEAVRLSLSDLTIGGVSFSAAAPVPLTPEGAEALDAELTGFSDRISALEDTLTQQEHQVSGLAAEIATLAAQGNAPGDGQAADLRATRDRLWAEHRSILTPGTADDFAEAMADDDEATALRLVDTSRLTELRRAERDHARLDAEQEATAREYEAVHGKAEAAQARLSAILAEIGLPDGLSAAELTNWLSNHAHAVTAQQDAAHARAALEQAKKRAQPVAAALADALGTGASGVELSDLLSTARTRISESRARQDLVAAATDQLAASQKALAQREDAVRQAEQTLDATLGELSAALVGLGIAIPDHVEPSDAVPVLRALMGKQQRLASLQDRIGKMAANTADFATKVGAVAQPWPELADKSALERVAKLDGIAEDHKRATERKRDLLGDSARAEALIAAAEGELQAIEAQAAEVAMTWDDTSRPEGFTVIAEATTKAARAAELSDRKAGTERHLAQTLGEGTLSDARTEMSGVTEATLTAQQQTLAPELAGASEAHDAAIRNLALAEQALRAVSGDGDVARLAQERQTLQEEIRAAAENGLRRRLGLLLAERALGRYREQHRGAMLAETKTAFTELTSGAYSGLSAQQEGKGEVLIAHRSSDGRSLRVGEETMSKGTRFQLYLALRLAGYRQMAEAGTVLPFLCDDIFETFDETRTAAACRLMNRIGGIGQALYFTHHAHVAEIAEAECPGVQVHRI